ncbi:NHLP leader peptide family RiPP precursor [Xanthobacter flavus]|uniref:NHLP leader peptide family RiPP precursor n=1 Tax=Xanthobacter flavus TaxID=281 RepID=UPI0037292D33
MTETAEARGGMSRLATLAATDPAFRARRLEHGPSVLAELGGTVPPGVTVKIIEDTPTVIHFVLPALRTEELLGAQLDQVVGGSDTPSDVINTIFIKKLMEKSGKS